MNDLEAAGGRIVVETIDVARLDAIAAEHELVIVAAGRGPLAELFPRNAERSVYDAPQRKLAMVLVVGAPDEDRRRAVRAGEVQPVRDRGRGVLDPVLPSPARTVLVPPVRGEAGRSDGSLRDCRTGAAVVARAKQVIDELMPWDSAWAKDFELADPDGFLVGAVTPTVRAPVGRLPSGRVVMPLGDTAIAMDPIGGQGANLGNKLARHLVAAVAAAPDATFDAGLDDQRRSRRSGRTTARRR